MINKIIQKSWNHDYDSVCPTQPSEYRRAVLHTHSFGSVASQYFLCRHQKEMKNKKQNYFPAEKTHTAEHRKKVYPCTIHCEQKYTHNKNTQKKMQNQNAFLRKYDQVEI